MKAGQYYYIPVRRTFRIYRVGDNSGGTFIGNAVAGEPAYHDREEARRRVFELNGWKYGGPNKKYQRK